MVLTLLIISVHSLRVLLPVGLLFASAPTYFLSWLCVKALTSLSPSKELYRQYDDSLYSIYQRFVLFFFETWTPIKIYFHGDFREVFAKKENALYLSNHQSSVDWIIVDMLAIRQGSLGHIRYVLKNELKWIPLYGFYFQQHGCIYVRRNDRGDLQRLERGMAQIRSTGLPVWLVIFPEGTRYNPTDLGHVIDKSKEFALKKGLAPLEHVLYPRSGATIAAIKALKDQLDAIYDITLIFGPTFDANKNLRLPAPSMIDYLRGRVQELHIDVRRIDIRDVPTESNEEISSWLYQRFQLKDKILERYYQINRDANRLEIFRSDDNDRPTEMPLEFNETFSSCLFFCLAGLPLAFTERGRSFYWKLCLIATPLTYLWMTVFPPNKRRIH